MIEMTVREEQEERGVTKLGRVTDELINYTVRTNATAFLVSIS